MPEDYSWNNRVKFVVRYMYDIDNNGKLDKKDFECLAVRNTVIEGKGTWNAETFAKNKQTMENLWNEIAELADFNKDGEVEVDEFLKGVGSACKGKSYADFPAAFKFFIEAMFRTIDVDGDGSIGIEEYRVDCVSRMAYDNITKLDEAYKALTAGKDGGIDLATYQSLYADFIGKEEDCPAKYLFGPLELIE